MLPTAHTSLGHLLTSNLWFMAPIAFPASAPIYQLRIRPLVISSPPIIHSSPESHPLLEAHST
jgi:hypothetical protein